MTLNPVRTSVVDVAEKPRILIVDDEKDFVLSLTDVLESKGYDVKTARTAREARKIIMYPGMYSFRRCPITFILRLKTAPKPIKMTR